jgi:hypothetical protein
MDFAMRGWMEEGSILKKDARGREILTWGSYGFAVHFPSGACPEKVR